MKSPNNRLRLAVSAAAGIVGAHWAAYALTVDPHDRAHLYASTGHRFFPYLAALVLASLVALAGRWIGDRAQGGGHPLDLVAVASRLGVLQLTGFLGLELAERALFGHGASFQTFIETPVIIGLVLQIVVAFLGALVISVVALVVDLATTPPALRRARVQTTRWFLSQVAVPVPAFAHGSCTRRGPPA
jgi:hypothetical protein